MESEVPGKGYGPFYTSSTPSQPTTSTEEWNVHPSGGSSSVPLTNRETPHHGIGDVATTTVSTTCRLCDSSNKGLVRSLTVKNEILVIVQGQSFSMNLEALENNSGYFNRCFRPPRCWHESLIGTVELPDFSTKAFNVFAGLIEAREFDYDLCSGDWLSSKSTLQQDVLVGIPGDTNKHNSSYGSRLLGFLMDALLFSLSKETLLLTGDKDLIPLGFALALAAEGLESTERIALWRKFTSIYYFIYAMKITVSPPQARILVAGATILAIIWLRFELMNGNSFKSSSV
ncbi:uncharacterized protein PAC_05271 [Phialocephala subalpina]|uniref:BTB domain-containing protein n=1 Tax=Phialocephala subalpina TaxID=576137 RepID=A0A1L7WRI9_9HELO|nr:uncharacterized protein PAC_05271 [Phialocephala subalpina]